MIVRVDGLRERFDREGVRRPNTFLVGAPKCGTTAMAQALGSHPSVYLSPTKEPHRFGADLAASRVRELMPDGSYVDLFRGADAEPVVAEASVWTMRSALAAAEIRRFEPDARIIVMLRDPVEMLASLHGELCRAGVEDVLDLRAALDAEHDRRAGRRMPRVPSPGQLLYSEAVAFPEQIQRFFDAFGSGAVHVVLLDDVRADPRGSFEAVQRFLGVEAHDDIELPLANAGRVVRAARLQRFARQPGRARSLARRLVPSALRPRVARRVVEVVERVNLAQGVRPQLAEDLDAELRARFAPMVDRLEGLIERDLSSWRSRAG